jgi:adenylate cyclase
MITSLKQRLAFFLILPVAILLFLMGLFGFIYAREIMLDEWREAAILKLERAAHHVDMRLSLPIELIKGFHETADSRGGYAVQEWILKQLKELEGVTKVNLQWANDRPEHMPVRGHGFYMGRGDMMRFHRARISSVTPPHYDAQTGRKTVSLVSEFKDESGRTVGTLEVALRFDYLMQDIIRFGWWQSDMACLVDKEGRYLAHTEAMMKGRTQLGETNDPLELELLAAMKEKPFGTLLDSGHPPRVVIGFYRTKKAPWAIILFAPGKKVLAPIVKFRFYYTIAAAISIIFVLFIIRFVAGNMARSIRKISQAAEQVAQGNYGDPLSIRSGDEIGQLGKSFNTMVKGLKERDFISNTFGRYVDQKIAKELMSLPEATRLGGEKREVAILICDIRGFTPLSETLSPEVTISILNHYFSHMIEVITEYQGIIVDFFGDGVLVFFDPLDDPVEPTVYRAVQCALEMQNEMEAFNAEIMKENLPKLEMGIGLNAGEVVVGNIGSETRAKYGIVGSPVNITQRIQSTAKGGDVVISEAVYCYVYKDLMIKRSFSVQLKGVQDQIKLYVVEKIDSQ